MTPKEKAEELVEKFHSQKGKFQQIKYWRWDMAKDCAIIAVEEIILAIDWHEYEYPNEQFEYWYEVKEEIENL